MVVDLVNLAILISGRGSNMKSILKSIKQGEVKGIDNVVVISNKQDALGLEIAEKEYGAKTSIIISDKNDESFESRLANELEKYNIGPHNGLILYFSFLAGTVSSTFGIGGGIIFVPCLIILLGFSMKEASATSQFALIFTSLSGLTLFIIDGKPNYSMGFILSVGSVIGGTIGSMLTRRMNSDLLLKIFSLILLVVSLKLIIDGSG